MENESLASLTELCKSYMDNLRFHKENGTLNSKREASLISKIDYIFEIIEGRSRKKKCSYEDSVDSKNNTVS